MAKLTKRVADSAKAREKDYFIWDDELPGLGLRVYTSGKRSYVIHYRFAGRSRRFTIGLHGFWTPELARQEARVLFGKIARGEDPSEQRQLNHKAITVKELCELYLEDLNAGLIMGKGGRPKKPTTIVSDVGRIRRHIIPLVGTRRVKDLTKVDINKVLKDVIAGKTNGSFKTGKLRGKSIIRGGAGATDEASAIDERRLRQLQRALEKEEAKARSRAAAETALKQRATNLLAEAHRIGLAKSPSPDAPEATLLAELKTIGETPLQANTYPDEGELGALNRRRREILVEVSALRRRLQETRTALREATGFQGAVLRQRDKLMLAEHLHLDGIAEICPVCEAPSERGREAARALQTTLTKVRAETVP